MKILRAFPPNYEKIAKRFNLKGKIVVFTYGDILYNPYNGDIPDHLLAHEQIHAEQQKKFPIVEAWWDKYMADDKFRLDQEVEAYRAQYQYASAYMSKKLLQNLLIKIATDLSSPVYGSMINYETAKSLILGQNEVD